MSAASRAKGFKARSLADYVSRELDPLIAARGFGEASLLLCWSEIVGARIAAHLRTRDSAMAAASAGQVERSGGRKTPRKDASGAGDAGAAGRPGFGLEAQHLAPIIIDRVNAHLGWRCVARIALRQEKLRPASVSRPGHDRAPRHDAAARARAIEATEGVADEGLRAALVRLGERALADLNCAPGDA